MNKPKHIATPAVRPPDQKTPPAEPKTIARWEGEGGANPTGPATSNSDQPPVKNRKRSKANG